MDLMLTDIEQHTKNANSVKQSVLNRLYMDGVITEQQAMHYGENWQVVVVKKSWYTTWLEKFAKKDNDNYIYKYLKFED